MRYRRDRAAEAKVARSVAVRRHLMKVGEDIAADAAAHAPKKTGAGAASIHAEAARNGTVHVSWDPAHDYMRFHELGTEDMPARPFLRPAARRHSR